MGFVQDKKDFAKQVQQISFYPPKSEKEYKSIQKIRSYPKLLILELSPNINLYKMTEYYKEHNVMIALLISMKDTKYLPDLFKLDIQGYFLKGMKSIERQVAVNSLLNGIQYIHPTFVPILLERYKTYKTLRKEPLNRPKSLLSQREWDILEQIVQGKSNDKIGEHFNIVIKTVKNHVSCILKKLNVSNRTRAAVVAIKNNWVSLK
ncbi:response regulator transcription factor [Lederbergia citri]|uniref:Response regulator transcription factor n=1 Tax=Lederbergia citri TaxID=2833580 RepID=A0A942YGQ5_9BACI|nr:response regulator transcription factor [Lederbergia citri]MBS4195752.1 response regulator transcription factor [Lederbergia citri]